MSKDWRLENLESNPLLRGARFIRKPYRMYAPNWDHDHCAGCWVKFMEIGTDSPHETILHEGFEVTDDYPKGAEYEWVCPSCFEEFGQAMEFVSIKSQNEG